MEKYKSILEWIDQQEGSMLDQVIRWSRINSHTFNLIGLKSIASEIKSSLEIFKEKIDLIDLPPMEFVNSQGQVEPKPLGQGLRVFKRPSAKRKALLVCHMDTVYPSSQDGLHSIERLDENTLKGPGVTDAKGGIVVLLKALEAFERSPMANELGWCVFINPDEEVGSPGSSDVLKGLADKNDIGLIFEPCLPNGNLVSERKGSGNFTLVVTGRSAHAGRDFHLGRNAIDIVAKIIVKISALNNSRAGLIVNIGMIEGGVAVNVVPDIAIARFNIRIDKRDEEAKVWVDIKRIFEEYLKIEGITIKLHGGFFSPPKPFEEKTRKLFEGVKICAAELGVDLDWQSTGGVCDGNRLAAFGLTNVDTLGVRGGNIHNPNEFLCIDSLTERTKLTTLFLMKCAEGKIDL